MKYNFHNDVICLQNIEILKIQFCYIQKAGQDHWVKFSQFAGKYQNLQKSCIFTLTLSISEISTFQNFQSKQFRNIDYKCLYWYFLTPARLRLKVVYAVTCMFPFCFQRKHSCNNTTHSEHRRRLQTGGGGRRPVGGQTAADWRRR